MGDARANNEPVSVFQRRDPGPLLPETRGDHRASRRLDQGHGKRHHGETNVARDQQTFARDERRRLQEDLPAAQGEAAAARSAGVRGRGAATGHVGGSGRRDGQRVRERGRAARHRHRRLHGEDGERHVRVILH